MMRCKYLCFLILLVGVFLFVLPPGAHAQEPDATVHGQVVDPSGAVIPQAEITVTSSSGKISSTRSDQLGAYRVRGLAPGVYTVTVSSPGFAPYASSITLSPGQNRNLKIAMQIEVEQQQVTVSGENQGVSTSMENNASAIVIKGKDLAALSDDPDQLANELQALAGPAAGPNGGQIYIDGFTGGQMPPKSSIREIRINQNPFSAQFDRLGYGRIEIFTKPGTDKLHGQFHTRGNSSAFNSRNPILQTAEPSYYGYDMGGSVGGPLSKHASFFVSGWGRRSQDVSVIDAIDPASVTPANPSGTLLSETYPNPSSFLALMPRVDLQVGKANTLTFWYGLFRRTETNGGVGPLSLPEQASDSYGIDNIFRVSDSLVLSPKIVDDIRFSYDRAHNQSTPHSSLPSVTVQGSFATGGNNSQTMRDDQGTYELQNYFTAAEGRHALSFGARLRLYRDKNYTSAGTNGAYTFQSLTDYLNKTPQTYQVTVVNHYTAQVNLFDAALFYQDDWRINPRFTLGYGLRWETQNRISDKSDWAPRLSFAYALDGGHGKNARTVLRAGYGWFYERFNVPNGYGASVPYLVQAIHQNGINQQVFIETNPPYTESAAGQPVQPPLSSATAAAPSIYRLDPHFHASTDMQAAVGVDRQIAKRITSNLTYIYGRGVHQYLTNNVTAPSFPTADQGIYPDQPLLPPDENIYQFQSGGVYRQNEIIASVRANYGRVSLMSYYAYNHAEGDTEGVDYIPSVAQDPGLDYGRVNFGVPQRFLVLGNFMFPYAVSATPFFFYSSGRPYTITAGSDLTRNNAFNARPTFAADCSAPGVVSTQFGCLNTQPFGTGEKMIPVGLGTGPSNYSLNMRVSKVIGIGPRVESGQGPSTGGGHYHSRGLSGGFSGDRGGPGKLDASVPRRYALSLEVFATNVLNHQNLGTPNGALSPQFVDGALVPQPFFGKSQSLAGGFFGHSTSGNRSVFLEARFSF